MARRVVNRTAKGGATPGDRRVFADATGVTAAPMSASDGFIMEQNEFVNLLFGVNGTDPVFSIQVWWYSQISGMWHKGTRFAVNDDDIVTLEPLGLNRLYLQIDVAPSGTNPELNGWIALVRPV